MLLQSQFYKGGDQDRWDYTNPGPNAINSGDVVVIGGDPNVALGSRIGCCTAPQGIDPGKLGSLAMKGIFKLNKPDAIAFNQGDPVFWDDVNNKATQGPYSTANQVVFAGLCALAAAATDDNVKTEINEVGNYVFPDSQPATTTTSTSTSTTSSTTTTVHV